MHRLIGGVAGPVVGLDRARGGKSAVLAGGHRRSVGIGTQYTQALGQGPGNLTMEWSGFTVR